MRKLLSAVLVLSLAPLAASAEDVAPVAAPAATPPAAPAEAPVAPTATLNPAAPTATLTAAPGSEEAELQQSGFHVGVGLDNSMSNSTIYGEYFSPFVGSSIAVSPSYSFDVKGKKLAASANASFSYEYTPSDNDNGRQWDYGDVALGLSAPALFKDEKLTGISISPRIGASLPIGFQSRWRGTITNLTAGVGLGRNFGKVNVGLSFGAGHTFYSESTRNLTPAELSVRDEQRNLVYVCRSDSDNCGLRGTPTLFSLSTGANVSVAATDRLGFSIGLNLSKAQKFPTPIDQHTTPKKDVNGNPVAAEWGASDNMIGTLGASYQLTDTIGMSLSMATAQTPLGADNRGLEFPWFNFKGVTGGYTSYSLGMNASF